MCVIDRRSNAKPNVHSPMGEAGPPPKACPGIRGRASEEVARSGWKHGFPGCLPSNKILDKSKYQKKKATIHLVR